MNPFLHQLKEIEFYFVTLCGIDVHQVPIGTQYLHIFIKIIAPNAIEYEINFGIFPLFCKIHFAIAYHMIGANSIYKRLFLTGTDGRMNLRPKVLGQLYRSIASTTISSV